ncbi:hypothetical protein G6011_00148 [Alternaria panax]|uniref:Ankyrin n=1 Tax=Alternaria panax TaxID=48097 RepID=A0AAD4IID2_9PLEO|nr:hypothetical protein G6011_00148 [Alternaria panax]
MQTDSTKKLIAIDTRSKQHEQHLVDLKDALELDMAMTHSTLQDLGGGLQRIHITQKDVRERVDELHERHDTEEALRKHQRILHWLTPIDHASEQRDAISRRQAGTGGWLLNLQTYQDWLDTNNHTLFCPGIPGAGKTVFASIINADLWERYHRDLTVGSAHIFCNYRRQNEQTLEALLSSLLKQLVEQQVFLPKSVEDLYDSQQNGASDRIEATTRALQAVIAGYSSPKTVRIALKKLAFGSDAYDDVYNQAMERIGDQGSQFTELAKQALALLTCAQMPLSTLELQEALGVEIDEPELDPDNYPDIEDILAACVGLVTVYEDSGIIRLVHYTTQEYLERTLDRWFAGAEAMMVDVCLSYLCLDRHADPANLDLTEDSPWYTYAAISWVYHAWQSPSSLVRVVDFLTRQVHFTKSAFYWSNGGILGRPRFNYERFIKSGRPWTTGFHFALETNLEDAALALLQRGIDVNSRDSCDRTPLMVAAQNGNEAAVEQLLKLGPHRDAEIDQDEEAKAGSTALHLASEFGHASIVKLLLDAGATINLQDSRGNTPILAAINFGATEVVEVLLHAKSDLAFLELKRSGLPTLLGQPIEYFRILLDAGADPNIPNAICTTPLKEACCSESINWSESEERFILVVKALLDAGANINYIDSKGLTAYQTAIRENHIKIAEYLCERGADPELGLQSRSDSPHK